MRANASPALFATLSEKLAALDAWDAPAIKEAIRQTGIAAQAQGAKLFMPIRMLLTGQQHGPDLASIASVYDREALLAYLQECVGGW